MAALNTGKIATVIFENMLETYMHETALLERVMFYKPTAKEMQNSGNTFWRPVQQHAPVTTGWDSSDGVVKTGIIEQTYPASLSDPKNDFVELRADDLRDPLFWKRRGTQSGLQQATYLNQMIAERIKDEGSLFYRMSRTNLNGYNFIASAETIMAEREIYNSGTRTFILNNRETQRFANDLANRQTLTGRPETAWAQNQIGSNVAGFDVFTGSYLPIIAKGGSLAGVSLETTADGSSEHFPPMGASDSSKETIQNNDYRRASLRIWQRTHQPNAPILSDNLIVGDKFTIEGVTAVAKASKINTAEPMTFTVVSIPTGNIPGNAIASLRDVVVSPRPVTTRANPGNDPTIALQNAYANVTGTLVHNKVITRVNTGTNERANVFFDRMSVEVLGGSVPANLFREFGGHKVIQETMPNGQEFYMLYGGNIDNMTFKFRIFTWWGVTIANPEACGTCVTF